MLAQPVERKEGIN